MQGVEGVYNFSEKDVEYLRNKLSTVADEYTEENKTSGEEVATEEKPVEVFSENAKVETKTSVETSEKTEEEEKEDKNKEDIPEELRDLIMKIKERVEKGLFVIEEEETFYRLNKKSESANFRFLYQFRKKYPKFANSIKVIGASVHIDKKLYDENP